MVAPEDFPLNNHARFQRAIFNFKDGHDITVGDYLLTRLEQLGVTHMFGVPGDYNLGFLDLVEDHPAIEWVGNCNELNASYAADGYARVNNTVGVVLTTFGVGELSAINGIAGGKSNISQQKTFSEMVPVLNLVGVPSTVQQISKPLLHHTLGDGRFDAYNLAAQQFTYSQAFLRNKEHAPDEIDRVLTDCITKARPVYLALPTDLVSAKISSRRLRIPLNRNPPAEDPRLQSSVLDLVVKHFQEAEGDAVVLVDACAIRYDVKDELNKFIKKTGFPVFSTPMGKTAIDENLERYGGVYFGSISRPEIKEKVESAKLVLSVGPLKTDLNTANFSYNIPVERTIEVRLLLPDMTNGVGMKNFIPKLTERLKSFHAAASMLSVPKFFNFVPHEKTEIITHDFFWPRVGEFFRPKDIIVTETSSPNFAIPDIPLPEGSILVSQLLWGSIGWSVGSLLGASLAARKKGLGRCILFIGDGSIQLSVQELSTMLRVGVTPIIFLLNNSGYTVERYIRGMTRKYNHIFSWKWTSLLTVLGDSQGKELSKSYTVQTKDELASLLDDPAFARADKVQLVEVIMDKLDAPKSLRLMTGAIAKLNAY
ncbi:Pyruvate decarboxylase [Termitomyces sp. J132]|nr:Pyruvate decarboxylase [Termitomyces sp. J132]